MLNRTPAKACLDNTAAERMSLSSLFFVRIACGIILRAPIAESRRHRATHHCELSNGLLCDVECTWCDDGNRQMATRSMGHSVIWWSKQVHSTSHNKPFDSGHVALVLYQPRLVNKDQPG